MVNESNESRIKQALAMPYASIIRDNYVEWESKSNNSTMISTPKFSLTEVVNQFFGDDVNVECNVNAIYVDGPIDPEEKPHYHDSWVVGIIQKGDGKFIYEKLPKTEFITESVGKGDIIVIPKGAKHVFEADDLLYAAFEFGKEGDVHYQRHEYDE